MVKKFLAFLILVSIVGLGVVGCGDRKTASSGEAIEISKTIETVEEKVDYLLGQAKAFYNSKEFQDAVNIAQHILSSLDQDSDDAKSLLERAQEALVAQAKQAAESAAQDMQKTISGFGK